MWSVAFWDVVIVCMENAVCEDGICSVYIWWWLNVRESNLSDCFIVVCIWCM